MRFLKNDKFNKSILVISDIHLGAGYMVDGKRNYLEDFHYDSELVDFLEYYSSNEYAGREVELIINGDLFDLLAVPFVEYFDDDPIRLWIRNLNVLPHHAIHHFLPNHWRSAWCLSCDFLTRLAGVWEGGRHESL